MPPADPLDDVLDAIAAGDIERVKSHLSRYTAPKPAILDRSNDHGWTPLHMAARYGQTEVVKILFDLGASTTFKTSKNQTPIDLALAWGHEECAEAMGWKRATEADTLQSKHIIYEETGNFFTGNPLNRKSEVRENSAYLAGTLANARFLLMKKLRLPIKNNTSVLMTNQEVSALLKSVGYPHTPEAILEKANKDASIPIMVYLGENKEGVAYWALDISNLPKAETSLQDQGVKFTEARPAAFSLPRPEASITAQARSMIDWNQKNVFCPACGVKTYSGHGGYKRLCPEQGCVSNKGVQNISYARTDAVVIVLILNKDRTKCLLGRKPEWPKGTYSCIAGFIEPGESLEEAARREAYEETSIRLRPSNTFYHSSQPWPFPSQLMVGMVGVAEGDEDGTDASVKLVDDELEDAKWFTKEEVKLAMGRPSGFRLGGDANAQKQQENVPLNLPVSYAIARVLIESWVTGTYQVPLTNKL